MVSCHGTRERLEVTQAHSGTWEGQDLVIFHHNFPLKLFPSWLQFEGQKVSNLVSKQSRWGLEEPGIGEGPWQGGGTRGAFQVPSTQTTL